MLQNKKN